MKYFVWEKGSRGPIPVIHYHGLPFNSTTGKPDDTPILQKHPLKDGEEMLTLNQLMILYPYKEEK